MYKIIHKELERDEKRRRIWKGMLTFLGLTGIAPLFGSVIAGWLIPTGQFIVNWPLVLGGLAVSFLTMLALRYLWL